MNKHQPGTALTDFHTLTEALIDLSAVGGDMHSILAL
uniref:Uncharacterized protein n=1 Tax=Arundo donax TaxID=35708 RepID=A0A0A9CCL7_ARUDO